MNHSLQIYVSDLCYGCDEARSLASEFASRFPDLQVEVVDLDQPGARRPPTVFAVPTYLLDGELLWLGNPVRDRAVQEIAALIRQQNQ